MTTTTNETGTALVRVADATPAPSALMRPIARPQEILEIINETAALIRETLTDGVDYGLIPGTEKKDSKGKKPSKVLLKPGAEKISIAFGCRGEFEIIEKEVDHERAFRFPVAWEEAPRPWPKKPEADKLRDAGKGRWRQVNGEFQWQVPGVGVEETTGIYRYVIRCTLHRHDGTVVGQGVGACSSLESKYRSRPHDVENTVFKMAKKRAHIDAVLSSFGLSGMFTQDVLDEEGAEHGRRVQRDVEDVRDIMDAAREEAQQPARVPTLRELISAELTRIGVTEQRDEYVASLNNGEAPTNADEAKAVLAILRKRPAPADAPAPSA
jgi:hypothetical protein